MKSNYVIGTFMNEFVVQARCLTESFPRLDMDPKDSSQKRDQGGSVVNARLSYATIKIKCIHKRKHQTYLFHFYFKK